MRLHPANSSRAPYLCLSSIALAVMAVAATGASAENPSAAKPAAIHAAQESFSTFTTQAASAVSASAPDPCVEFAPGSAVTTPASLSSTNGKLEVNFSFQTGTDPSGLTRFCYINPDTGDQAPTLRLNPGDQLIIHFTNAISTTSAAAKAAASMPGMDMSAEAPAPAATPSDCALTTMTSVSTNLHFHGLNVSPACHQDEVVKTIIQPGQEFDYTVQIPANEPAGMYWYHPHPHGFSEAQLQGGATGAIIIEGIQNFNPVVASLPERIFIIRDQAIQPAQTGKSGAPAHDLTLNGVPVIFPTYVPSVLEVPASTAAKPVREFWRVANTASDTLVNLEYTIGGVAQTIQVIAIDGVALTDGSGNPVSNSTTSVVLGAGARAEFIVTTPQAGQTAQLFSTAWNNGTLGSTPLDYDPARPLANIVASAGNSDGGVPKTSLLPARIPAVTQSMPPLRFAALNTATATVQRSLIMTANLTSNAQFFITVAGQTPAVFNPANPPNIVTRVGTVEQWTVSNQSPLDHAFHIHQIHFRTLAINGVPVTDYTERDTIDVPHWTGSGAYPSVTLLMDFTDPGIAGTFVYHCHILNHEDRGMMGAIQVLPALIESKTTFSASTYSSTPGQSVTLTAALSSSGSTTIPTGTVTFTTGATTLGTSTLNSAGVATLTLTGLPVGTDSIFATYSGDINFASSSSSLTVTNTAAPSISSLSHNYGAVGAVGTLSGTNFGATQSSSTITVNGAVSTPTAWSATGISFAVPAGAVASGAPTSGLIQVKVLGKSSNGIAFTAYPDAVITAISPTSGPVGTVVTVTGTNLKDPQNLGVVRFAGKTVTPISVTATTVQLTVPSGAATGQISVMSGGVFAYSPYFTVTTAAAPAITRIGHNYGAPGATAVLTGTNFGASQGSSTVTFNGTAAKPTAWSATSISVPVPVGATTGNIVVTTTAGGHSNGIPFTVYPEPTITSMSPTSGPAGTLITVTGTNLKDPQNLNYILFGNTAVTATSITQTAIQFTVLAGAATGSTPITIYASGVPLHPPAFTVN